MIVYLWLNISVRRIHDMPILLESKATNPEAGNHLYFSSMIFEQERLQVVNIYQFGTSCLV